MKKSISPEQKLLTEVELELMTILWRLGEGNVTDVINELPNDRKLAYTSVSTIIRILEQKEILGCRKIGRGHIYFPLILKSDYESKAVKHVVDKVFEGTPLLLVKQLLNSTSLSNAEIEELKEIINNSGVKK
jgi:predicted transcriptional regulator